MYPRLPWLACVALLLGACAQIPLEQEAPAPEATLRAGSDRYPPATIEDAPLAAARATRVRAEEEKASSQPPAIWERLRAGFRIPDMDNGRVRMWERWYAERPEYVEFMVEMGRHFLYYVTQEVERRNMPSEIALLPMIESAYNPYAYSRSHASGMWQFIRSTGKNYGLRQNFWYDGRRDVIAATNAALDYLQDLHETFGSWDLAIAAYNFGENGLSRSIARNRKKKRPITYEKLWMPRETRNYFPKLQAVKNIIADPARFGLTLAYVPDQPYFATVKTDRHIDVKLAAELAEISVDEFRILNPAHNKPVIRAVDGAETLLLPVSNVETFQKNLQGYDAPLVTWQAYRLKRRDRLSKIAAKHGVSTSYLKEVNSINPRRRVRPGQTIVVPLKNGAEPYLPDLPAPRFIRVRYWPQPKKKLEQRDTLTSAPPPPTGLAQKPAVSTSLASPVEPLAQEDRLLAVYQPAD